MDHVTCFSLLYLTAFDCLRIKNKFICIRIMPAFMLLYIIMIMCVVDSKVIYIN